MTTTRLAILLLFLVSGCSLLKEKPPEESDFPLMTSKPLPPEEAEAMLKDVGKGWFYGQGVGETALMAGGVYLFPPYALYLLGNGALSLAGYEPIHVTDALPETPRNAWNSGYDAVTSGPGRLNAAVAGEEYKTPEMVKADLKRYLSRSQGTPKVENTNQEKDTK